MAARWQQPLHQSALQRPKQPAGCGDVIRTIHTSAKTAGTQVVASRDTDGYSCYSCIGVAPMRKGGKGGSPAAEVQRVKEMS